MAQTISMLTEESVQADPWGAIRVVVYNNPAELSEALATLTGESVPSQPAELFAWLQNYYRKNGNLNVLQEAANNVPIVGVQAKSFDWGGLLGGIVQGALGALGINNQAGGQQNSQYLEMMAAQQAQSQKMMNMVLLVLGIGVVGVIAFTLLKK